MSGDSSCDRTRLSIGEVRRGVVSRLCTNEQRPRCGLGYRE